MEQVPEKGGWPTDLSYKPGGEVQSWNSRPVFERRRFPRVKSSAPIQYKEIGRLSEPFMACLTKDIGEGGVKLTSNEFIPLDRRLIVELFLHNSAGPLRAIARVAWVTQLPYADRYAMGLEFIDFPEDHKKIVREYVQKKTKP